MGESQKDNDLFFVCSLIEHIARKTKNTKKYIIDKLEKENIKKISDELIKKYKIENGDYDIISKCEYRVPTIWELGRIYQRLIININKNEIQYIDTLVEVLSSWIIEKIDNYNSSMYYENPSYIYECYRQNKII